MKKYISIVILLAGTHAHAQLFVGSAETLNLVPGTTFSFNKLAISPSDHLLLSDNTVTVSSTPVTGVDGSVSILRVYHFTNPILFSGGIHFQYLDEELNGNIESDLQLFRRSGGIWLSPSPATVNTSANYADASYSSLNFDALTLAQSNAVLPLLANSLRAKWENNFVHVEWVILQNEIYRSFVLEASTDGVSWQAITTLQAEPIAGKVAYKYPDRNINFYKKQYRVKMITLSEREYYSTIVSITKTVKNEITVIARHGGSAQFIFTAPVQTAQLYNSEGRLLWRSSGQGTQADVYGLKPGVYIVICIINGETLKKRFVIPG